MNGQIVYELQADSPIMFKPDVMGSSTEIVVGGVKGTIELPTVSPGDSTKFRKIQPPPSYAKGTLNWLEKDNKDISWGRQIALPGGEAIATKYLMQFKLAKTRKRAMEQAEVVEKDLERWFAVLRDWVEVLTHQDLSISEPLALSQISAQYYWSWQSRKKWGMFTSQTISITSNMPDVSRAIRLEIWQKAIIYANKGILPPDEHLILRDALARFNRGQYKYSAIFSGMATELSLKKKLEEKLIRQRKTRTLIDSVLRNTLGSILDICETANVTLPPNSKHISSIRNKAVHKDHITSREEADEALRLSTELLALHSKI